MALQSSLRHGVESKVLGYLKTVSNIYISFILTFISYYFIFALQVFSFVLW